MQAGPRSAVAGMLGQVSDRLPGVDFLTFADEWRHRKIRGAQRAVDDGHYRDPAHGSGETHPARSRGEHGIPRLRGEVDPAVASKPALRGRVEGSQHYGGAGQRPRPRAGVGRGMASRDGCDR
ncbi:hypothetical protein JCM3263A_03520 [Thermobifida fusca]